MRISIGTAICALATALVFGCASTASTTASSRTFMVQPSPGRNDQERGLMQPVGAVPTWSRVHFWAALAVGVPHFLDDEQNLFLIAEQFEPGTYRKSGDQFARHDLLASLKSEVPARSSSILSAPLRITAYVGQSPHYDFERGVLRIFDPSARNVLDVITQSNICLDYGEQRQVMAAVPCLDVPGSFHPAQNSVGKDSDRITVGSVTLSPSIEMPRELPMTRDTAEQVIGAHHRCQGGVVALIDIVLAGTPSIRVRSRYESVATLTAQPTNVVLACATVPSDPRSYVRLF